MQKFFGYGSGVKKSISAHLWYVVVHGTWKEATGATLSDYSLDLGTFRLT